MKEQVTALLLDPILGQASVAEIVWLVSNVLGSILSLFTVLLAGADRRRVRTGQMRRRTDAGSPELRMERAGIAVLADAVEQVERLKVLFHIGHGAVGLAVVMLPSTNRSSGSTLILAITVWFLISSILILATTLRWLKARYDYRHARVTGRSAGWRETRALAVAELRTEFMLAFGRRRGQRE